MRYRRTMVETPAAVCWRFYRLQDDVASVEGTIRTCYADGSYRIVRVDVVERDVLPANRKYVKAMFRATMTDGQVVMAADDVSLARAIMLAGGIEKVKTFSKE